ncbi:MAG: CBS domain-containing protein [Candidatus Nanohaloarchaea archaeon]
MNAEEVSAEEIMDTDPVTVSSDQSLSQIRNTMEEKDLRAVPVVNSGKLKGVIGYRDLIRHVQFNPQTTKPEKVIHQPPEFDASDSLQDICGLRINSGRKLMVQTQDDRLKAVIGDEELLRGFEKIEELSSVTSLDVGPEELLQVFEEDSVEKARHMMLDNNISRLPVLDEDGRLTGIVRSTEMLKILINRESQSPGGTSGRSQKDTQIAGGSEKDRLSDVTVREIMDRTPPTHEGHEDCDKLVEEMMEKESSELLITDRDYPESIVTVKDFAEHIDSSTSDDYVLVNIVGLDVDEEKAAVHDKIAQQMSGSLGRKLDRPEEVKLHFKKSEKDGKKHRWELDLKLESEFGIQTVNEEGWEMLDVLDTALHEINEVVRRKREERNEHRS